MTILDVSTVRTYTNWHVPSDPESRNVRARIMGGELLNDEGDQVLDKDGKPFIQYFVEHKVLGDPGNRDVATSVIKAHDKHNYKLLRDRFRSAFEEWEAKMRGETAAPKKEGAPLLNYTELSLSTRETLVKAGIETVEDLAAIDPESMKNFGPGARDWRNTAKKTLREQNKAE